MAKPLTDENEEKPLDPAVERVRRRLVRFVGINLGILFIALMAVVAALVYRMSAPTPSAPQAAGGLVPNGEGLIEGRIALPAGARINSHAVSGDRLTLDVGLADGGRAIFLYEMGQQRMIGRFDIVTQP
jgi:hypothetical protein